MWEVFMLKEVVTEKTIDGKRYYTSTYFAQQVYLDSRQARRYLQEFKSLEGYTNPRFYDEKTMSKAIDAYLHSKAGELLKEHRRQRMLEIERERAKEEENAFIEQENTREDNQNTTIEDIARTYVDSIYKSELVLMLLRTILYNQGFVFDEKQFKQDLVDLHILNSVRQPGDSYTEDELILISRTHSIHSYIKK